MKNLYNLNLRVERMNKDFQELIEHVRALKDEDEQPLTFDKMKKISIDRLTYLGQKMKSGILTEDERNEWALIGDWLESVSPIQTREGRLKSEVEEHIKKIGVD